MSILDDDPRETELFVYAGLPGAGKSKAAAIGVGITGGRYVSLSDILRDMAPDGTEGHALGELSTQYREQYGPAYLVERFIGNARRDGYRAPVHLDSIRCVEELNALREAFGSLMKFIRVSACFGLRYERVKGRGRDGETDFNRLDMKSRDARERSWGVNDLTGREEVHVVNEGTMDELRDEVRGFVNE